MLDNVRPFNGRWTDSRPLLHSYVVDDDGNKLYQRLILAPYGQVRAVSVRACGCGFTRGDPGGLCETCGYAIPDKDNQ